jgi:hypothetical protein
MYAEHESFPQPDDENVLVWRYLDFTKFVALFENRSLHFTRIDRFSDLLEGSWPAASIVEREQLAARVSPMHRDLAESYVTGIPAASKRLRTQAAANCWHMNEHESAAMWRLYLSSKDGIAIRSTYARLKAGFTAAEPVYLGKVNYIDYSCQHIDIYNLLNPLTHKRKSFEHEREVRAAIVRMNPVAGQPDQIPESGIEVPVDPETLIDAIFVAPTSPAWFRTLVEAVLRRYSSRLPVLQSGLSQGPLF